jgi:hypothetical protein
LGECEREEGQEREEDRGGSDQAGKHDAQV